MKTFPAIICICSILLLPALSLSADFYVNGATGNDNNSCNHADVPCKTIKAALHKTGPGNHTIRVTKGTYIEDSMWIWSNRFITIKGGYDNDFTPRTCYQPETIIKTATNGSRPELFRLASAGDGTQLSLTLDCLHLQYNQNSDIKTAIYTHINDKAEAWFNMRNSRISDFPDTSPVYFFSDHQGRLHVLITRSTILRNQRAATTNGLFTIEIYSWNEASLDILFNKVLITDNCNIYTNPLLISSYNRGAAIASMENTIISGNHSNSFVIRVSSQQKGSMNLSLTNDTITSAIAESLQAAALDDAGIIVNLANTILSSPTASSINLTADITSQLTFNSDYSILGAPDISPPVTYHSTHEVHGDPLLDSRFHLRQGSPEINAGICGYWDQSGYHRIAPDDDIDGDKRPGLGTYIGCDIGADEYKAFPWPMFLPAIIHKRQNPWTIPTHPSF